MLRGILFLLDAVLIDSLKKSSPSLEFSLSRSVVMDRNSPDHCYFPVVSTGLNVAYLIYKKIIIAGQQRSVSCVADTSTQKEVVVECFAPYDDHRCVLLVFSSGLRIRIHFIRIRHFRMDTNPDPDPIRIRIQSGSRALKTKNRKKITAEKKKFPDQTLQFTYP
jgi:hypothetical protein